MKAQKVFEFLGSRNLNSSPIDITGLQGNTYDYELVFFGDGANNANEIRATFNNDSTANYRDYAMIGRVSIAFAQVFDSVNYIRLGKCKSHPTLLRFRIGGDSSDERVVSGLVAAADTASNREVQIVSGYWKDTVTEIQSLQISTSNSVSNNYHIILYRVPKAKSQQNWEQIGDPLVWSLESAEKSFTGLDGNQDEQYKISYSLDQELSVEIENDATASYIRQRAQNSGGTLTGQNTTENAIVTDGTAGDIIINAVTGSNRLCLSTASNTSAAQQSERSIWYTDTITNISSLFLTPSSSASGQAILYRKIKKDAAPSELPWRLSADPVQISGDFSAGVTFSNLEGDKSTLFMVEFTGANTSGDIELRSQVNSDTSNINVEQFLKADTSTVSAAAATRTYIVNCKLQNGDQAHSNTILYPRTGADRPMLTECSYDENALEKLAQWYGESVTEMTSLKVYASTSNSITGTLKIWRLS